MSRIVQQGHPDAPLKSDPPSPLSRPPPHP
jgi:hypothetical protein